MNFTIPQLATLVNAFFTPQFDFERAKELFGDAGKETDARIELIPKSDSGYRSIALEKLAGPKGATLAGISLVFETPVTMDFEEIASRLGPENEMPRLKPNQDRPIRFLIQADNYTGYIILKIPTSAKPTPRRPVTGMILRRFAKSNDRG